MTDENQERARIRRKEALEKEAAEQLKVSRKKPLDEQLADAKREYAANGQMALFFQKASNPMYMNVRGKQVLYSSNTPSDDVFILPLNGALGNLGTIRQYEKKGWPIIGHANLPSAEKAPTEGLRDIIEHLEMIDSYRHIYANKNATDGAPVVGTEKKIRAEHMDAHEEIVPKSRKRQNVKQMLKEVESEEPSFDDDDDGGVEITAFDQAGKPL